jgi:ABC-type multidrug transport system fused ATPase/permease subunit
MGVYVSFGLANSFFQVASTLASLIAGFRASARMHDAMFASILRARMQFFQETPHGRLMNRFSSDISEVDQVVVGVLVELISATFRTLGSFLMVAINAVVALVLFLPFVRAYISVQRLFNMSCTELRRLIKVCQSPMYDHFSSMCQENGLSSVRSFHNLEHQVKLFQGLVANRMRALLTNWFIENWYYQRVEPFGAILVLLVSLYIVFGHNSVVTSSSAALALSLSYALIQQLPHLIRMFSEVTIRFNCVERVLEYTTEIAAEAAAVVAEHRPPEGWPTNGALDVENLKFRYKPDGPLVLHGLSFSVTSGERIGIVGRTGAGKSTLLLALFRTVEPEAGSKIVLDGHDILAMGLADLRRCITMIPQDPVLFEATLHYNCDPFSLHSNHAVRQALELAQLGPWLQTQEQGLDMKVSEGGQNLSAGQRQLVTIARAMLRGSKLVVFDEATASLDTATDDSIQKAIRTCFRGSSTLTIAHRLGTILDSDRVMVLKKGLLAEFGHPDELRNIKDGIFQGMVREYEKTKNS